jgi:hypothetical protein
MSTGPNIGTTGILPTTGIFSNAWAGSGGAGNVTVSMANIRLFHTGQISQTIIPLVRLDALTISSEPTWFQMAALSSGGEGVFAGDPPAWSEATEGGVEHRVHA